MTRTALITGASSGFGRATAQLLAARGFRLVLLARRRERLEQLAEQLHGVAVHVMPVDISDADALNLALAELPPAFIEVDVLINNAGLALGLSPAQEADLEQWVTMVETNIVGLMRITHRLLPGMVARNRGHIINIGSIAGSWPYPGSNVYGATKAFVQQFSRNLRADLLGTAVRITNIDPGLAETEFSEVRFRGDRTRAAEVYTGTQPLTAEDVAATIDWVIGAPPHVNINALEIMPVCQAWQSLAVARQPAEAALSQRQVPLPPPSPGPHIPAPAA